MVYQVALLASCTIGALSQTVTVSQDSTATGFTTSAPTPPHSTAFATVLALGTLTTGLAGSVVSADPCGETTYALTCTDTDLCSGYDLTFYATAGPTDYKITYATSTLGVTGSIAESCSLAGSPLTLAVCAATVSLSANGKNTQSKTTSTLSSAQITYVEWPITAGGSLLAGRTAACTTTAKAAAPTAGLEVYKVLVVPAAAVAVAAAASTWEPALHIIPSPPLLIQILPSDPFYKSITEVEKYKMYGMSGPETRYGNELMTPRSQHMRCWTRQRPRRSVGRNTWMPLDGAAPYGQDLYGQQPLHYGISDDFSQAVPPYAAGSVSTSSPRRHTTTMRGSIPFDRAAEAMYQALQYATKHCKSIQEQFDKEVMHSSIAQWAAPELLGELWTAMLDRTGIDVSNREPSITATPVSSSTTIYRDVVNTVSEGLEGIGACSRASGFGQADRGELKLSPEVFRNTINKLGVTFHGIEEMMKSVRKDRLLMDALVKDFELGMQLLGDIEEVWRARACPVVLGGRDMRREDGYEWRRFGGV
ncbi:hypothetical protein LTR62_002395 [Meristemomyces frigidus]|uniref:Uncharacterized protein n=1 Tax=Meristemomyces frigidus TaxID=1508187 RepID=A0AAN7YQ70_9PEZI|nr:hypothetical protein LTR62_002395 [Meristemomyces frigidus]